MRVLALGMVRNEADVIEAWVRHTCRFADALVVVENGSADATPAILAALQREGLPLIVMECPTYGFPQSEATTAAFRRMVPLFRPDAVLPLDADEFVIAPSRAALAQALAAIPQGAVGRVRWRTYVPSPDQAGRRCLDPPREITHRLRAEPNAVFKVVIPTAGLDPQRVRIGKGNHAIQVAGSEAPRVVLEDLPLGHFPVRSYDQICAKAINSWGAHLAATGSPAAVHGSWHLRDLFARFVSDRPPRPEDVTGIAINYARNGGRPLAWPEAVVEDPIAVEHAIRYAGMSAGPSGLGLIARTLEAVALRASGRAAETPPEMPEAAGLTLDLPPLRHLAARHRPRSALQLGCGAGGYLRALMAREGVEEVFGVDDAAPDRFLVAPDRFARRPLGEAFDLGRRHDLVFCIETQRPIGAAETEAEALVGNLVRHAHGSGRVVFSAAMAAPDGTPTIRWRPLAEWLGRFAARGWRPCLFETLALRGLASLPWLRAGLLVLAAEEAPAETEAAAAHLVALDAPAPPRWPAAPRPRVIAHPLRDPLRPA
ncbi:hypothetical protein GCM10010964_23830 [Caldovatus sediminis]|uniref:Glycosyl transferase family 2 n=1 Tax=Caldovatus sediminis TaxID=2041189 RepID=A0A8J2ZCH8_9PROT|nr:glycosyltransferase family 2 protein [Caldovatus sediminis]GGG35192.1 hypothetical protein GCM10010964_23830 [Caldovatus sediminis]